MDETSKKDSENTHFAPTVVHSSKAMFIVRVSYFVQVVLFFGMLSRPISLKLPFMLKRPDSYDDITATKDTLPATETKILDDKEKPPMEMTNDSKPDINCKS